MKQIRVPFKFSIFFNNSKNLCSNTNPPLQYGSKGDITFMTRF